MNVTMRSANDVLTFKFNEETQFSELLGELNGLLEQPLFNQDGYYPRAFFDIGKRILNEDEIVSLMKLLKQHKKIIFDGVTWTKEKENMQLIKRVIRNGETIRVDVPTLFLDDINPGAFIHCYSDVYFMGRVSGCIIGMNSSVKICGREFERCKISINQKTLQDVTISAMVTVYYEDNDIVLLKEEK